MKKKKLELKDLLFLLILIIPFALILYFAH